MGASLKAPLMFVEDVEYLSWNSNITVGQVFTDIDQ